ncbi:unnamed protein product [Polarella glacialis]|uniref:Uncharacterized protein n=1 Tax=Polarella glacialis TaxID=89957 RepID=A0A813E208_POLGL|nr:unnamed protein product [Polarella glacialis]
MFVCWLLSASVLSLLDWDVIHKQAINIRCMVQVPSPHASLGRASTLNMRSLLVWLFLFFDLLLVWLVFNTQAPEVVWMVRVPSSRASLAWASMINISSLFVC